MIFKSLAKFKSIQSKLLLITLSITAFSLILFSITQAVLGFYYAQEQLEDNLSVTAKTIGFQSTASLEFLDSYSATEILTSLKQSKEIVRGCMYDHEQNLFASFVTGVEVCPLTIEGLPIKSNTIFPDYIYTTTAITNKHETIGYVFLESRLNAIWNYFVEFTTYVVLILMGTLFLAYKLVLYLQGYITKPVGNLLGVMNKVSKTNSYELRASKVSNDEIGDLVVEFNNMLRLIQIHNEGVEQERKNAEKANNAKSEFLSNMSHEIRTPLNGIIGTADLMLRGNLADEEKASIEIIAESGKSLLAIINDVLDISKIEAGKIQIFEIETNLREVTESCIAAFTAMASMKKLELNASFVKDLPENVWVDEVRFRQILTNLISNAIKFTPQGHIDVTLMYEKLEGDKDQLILSVTDTGVGISKTKLEAIFARFTQEDGSITRNFGGTGLGLSICKELVNLMNGTITVESEKNKGAKFTVTLPVKAVENTNEQSRGSDHKVTINNMKVLVAEDDLINQKIIEKMISSLGHNVHLAENGAVAVEEYKEGEYDIVLMDMQMPVMDGIDATKEIRAFERSENRAVTPIVALTANALETHKKLCFEAGMNGYFTKPITMQSIEEMLKTSVS